MIKMVYLDSETLGWRIRRIRKHTGMNQTDFAREIGITQCTLSKYEMGRSLPNAETLLNVCLIGGYSADYLLGRSGKNPHDKRRGKMVYLNREKFGEKVRAARKSTGMNRTDFAREIGVAPQTLSDYERGTRLPDAGIILNICSAGNCSADYLLDIKK